MSDERVEITTLAGLLEWMRDDGMAKDEIECVRNLFESRVSGVYDRGYVDGLRAAWVFWGEANHPADVLPKTIQYRKQTRHYDPPVTIEGRKE